MAKSNSNRRTEPDVKSRAVGSSIRKQDAAYREFLEGMRSRIDAARMQAARVVNRELVSLYWDIGRSILEEQQANGWGDGVVEQLSKDLGKRYPGTFGFSARNLWDMRRFYENWSRRAIMRQAVAELGTPLGIARGKDRPKPEKPLPTRLPAQIAFMRQAVAELPWGHHLLLLNKLDDVSDRIWYMRQTVQLGWSRNILLNQLLGQAHKRIVKRGKGNNFMQALAPDLATQAEEVLKSSYNLEFLGISKVMSERDLEQRLIENVRDFILELGYGFCFVGQQHVLKLGRKSYAIDLLFYHRFLRCLVAIELKVNEFEPEYAGKMDFYLNVLNDKERAADDNPSIGIILCAENDDLEVEYSLRSKANPIGVATHTFLHDVPKTLRGQLPTARQLKAVMSKALEEERPLRKKRTNKAPKKKAAKAK
ncbi:MAG: PDDEXK nuclease domain-containing protein [Flavobacteriales bacterium]